jgi:hypothetical protein
MAGKGVARVLSYSAYAVFFEPAWETAKNGWRSYGRCSSRSRARDPCNSDRYYSQKDKNCAVTVLSWVVTKGCQKRTATG